MFDLSSAKLRETLKNARLAAVRLDRDFIDIEHFLIGLLEVEDSNAGRILDDLGVDLKASRETLESFLEHGTTPNFQGQMPFTPEAKRAIEFSIEEAQSLGRDYWGTEHLLLGVLRANKNIGLSPRTKGEPTLFVKFGAVRSHAETISGEGKLS